VNFFRKNIYNEKQREAILGLVMFLVNVGSYLFILPFAQSSANHHMDAGPFIGALYFITTVFLIAFYNSREKLGPLSRLILLLSCINFIYFGWKLFHLTCTQCLANG
jgi:ABC-type Fe3+-siderophore transport system permease subunit